MGPELKWRLTGAYKLYEYMPETAYTNGRNGSAIVLCSVTEKRTLSSCKVAEDQPKHMSFGDATALIARRLAFDDTAPVAPGDSIAVLMTYTISRPAGPQNVVLTVRKTVAP